MTMVRAGCIASAAVVLTAAAAATRQQFTDQIWLNQVGFYPTGPKLAIVQTSTATRFYVTTPQLHDTVFSGSLTAATVDEQQRKLRVADFSALKRTGRLMLVIPGVGTSMVFEVRPSVYGELARAALKAFYFQRASTALPRAFAGPWSRAAGHPDTMVLIHESAASSARPAGTIISAPFGWYDAGDYNKYVVNSGITMGTLLSLLEDFPAYSAALDVAIPERGNALPDLLDEALWNLRWMLAMQDPSDGGVYHKLTNPDFDPLNTRPTDARQLRYVVQKSTPATLDFAAVTAQAARVLRAYDALLPALADTCLHAAERAWQWAELHPDVAYDQDKLNSRFAPPIVTGEYGDHDFSDEWVWAAAELLVTTGNMRYYATLDAQRSAVLPLPSWNQVRALGYYTLLRRADMLPRAAQAGSAHARAAVLGAADALRGRAARYPYAAVFARKADDLVWGSTAVAANQGILLIQAFRLTGKPAYLSGALGNLDYLLGRNPTGYSYVTGFGARTPMHPHHRPTVSDSIDAPVPGMLVGGPNPNAPQQDHCTSYKSSVADLSYTDDECSYASNEIAINWNAALVYLVNAVEALQVANGFAVSMTHLRQGN